MAVCCIYAIINRLNGKSYIGSTTNNIKRWSRHKKMLMSGTHPSKHLQSSWHKYGPDNFEFRILEIVEDPIFLIAREQFWLWREQTYENDRGYNTNTVAWSRLGQSVSEETKKKMSASQRMRAKPFHSDKTKEKIRLSLLGNGNSVGKVLSKEHIEKIRRHNIGNKNALGCKRSDEFKNKIRISWIERRRRQEAAV